MRELFINFFFSYPYSLGDFPDVQLFLTEVRDYLLANRFHFRIIFKRVDDFVRIRVKCLEMVSKPQKEAF